MADLDGQHTGLRLAAGGTNQQLCATQLPARRQGSDPLSDENVRLLEEHSERNYVAARCIRINAIVERSAILDTSKFVRIAVDWLLRSDIGQVIKTIVDDEAFPDYAMPKKTAGRKKRRPKSPR